MIFRHELCTRYSETAQDGIIHHSSFVIYLEVARLAFFKKFGCDINELEKKKIFSPVTDLSVKYLKPLYSLEDVAIDVSVSAFSKVRFTLDYQIFRQTSLIAKGSSSHCFLNEFFKPIAIPKEIVELFRKG